MINLRKLYFLHNISQEQRNKEDKDKEDKEDKWFKSKAFLHIKCFNKSYCMSLNPYESNRIWTRQTF